MRISYPLSLGWFLALLFFLASRSCFSCKEGLWLQFNQFLEQHQTTSYQLWMNGSNIATTATTSMTLLTTTYQPLMNGSNGTPLKPVAWPCWPQHTSRGWTAATAPYLLASLPTPRRLVVCVSNPVPKSIQLTKQGSGEHWWSHRSTKTLHLCCDMDWGRSIHVPAKQLVTISLLLFTIDPGCLGFSGPFQECWKHTCCMPDSVDWPPHGFLHLPDMCVTLCS